ncbi:MAG: toluene tolerance protein [Magnetovibrio sp.]|nr:toluene tolerance protein [Magnetovibrio sp.]
MSVKQRFCIYFLVSFFSFCLNTTAFTQNQDDNHGYHSGKFIQTLAQRALDSLTDRQVPRHVRIERFRALFDDFFAVRSIGKRVLGRFWRKASSSQRMDYQKYFERLMVVAYVDRFANYTGKGLIIEGNRIEDGVIATVFSKLYRKNNKKPVRIDWIVGNSGTVFKVVDVKVEGVSMTATLRSEFTAIIRQHNGKITGLIRELEKKTKELSANLD